MNAATSDVFRNAISNLRDLSPDAKPAWGSMSPQQMVEHLVGSWRISNGNARVKVMLSDDDVQEKRAFLFSEHTYPKNIPNPVFSDGPPPLRKASLADAIDQLSAEMEDFFNYHSEHKEALEVHPVFGPLDFNGWMLFQTKHMQHHLEQFGVKLTGK